MIKEYDIALVVGTRPNFVKAAPLLKKLEENKKRVLFIHTGQHFDKNMSNNIFEDLKISDIKLSKLRYGVIALGDSSHYEFCKAGKDIDERLKFLGASCILDRLDCDYDTEGSIEWSQKFFDII